LVSISGTDIGGIPIIGLGTWDLRGRTCARMVEQALRLGYRHIDTAEMYDNEREVGEGLRACGLGRAEAFITTKVSPSHFAARDLERAAKESLSRLRLSEVDLLLLHWPNPQIPLRETLGALCKVKRMGLARSIGVSNFTVALLDEAVAIADEPLVGNQIEMHPFLDQSKVVAACRRYRMAVVAYSPIARGGAAGNAAHAYWQGAWQDGGSGEPAVPGAAGDCRHSPYQPQRAPSGELRDLRLRALAARDGADRLTR
jgi:2,5-diketo-D-gluconate reductase B